MSGMQRRTAVEQALRQLAVLFTQHSFERDACVDDEGRPQPGGSSRNRRMTIATTDPAGTLVIDLSEDVAHDTCGFDPDEPSAQDFVAALTGTRGP